MPYKQVLSHGFVMDGKGVKMSKSQWNAVAPGEITKKYGADILRLWAVSVDYQADCSMSEEILKQISENYRKVRNTFRFLLANINNEDDFTKADLVDVSDLPTSAWRRTSAPSQGPARPPLNRSPGRWSA